MIVPIAAYCLALLTQSRSPQAQTELIPSTSTVVPGKPFLVALHMKMAPGWHSYYINPGESGMATKISWQLPTGFSAGPIQWPAPERIVVDGVAGYVYQREVWLTTAITPPVIPWDSGRPPAIRARVSWLLCREACFPQQSSLVLPVYESDHLMPNPAFAYAIDSMPRPGNQLRPRATSSGRTIILSFGLAGCDASKIRFFPADASYFGADILKVTPTTKGIQIQIPVSQYAPTLPTRLTGDLVIAGRTTVGTITYWIDVQVTKR